jgi:hypothetical protein
MQDAIASGALGALAAVMGKVRCHLQAACPSIRIMTQESQSGMDSNVTQPWGPKACSWAGFPPGPLDRDDLWVNMTNCSFLVRGKLPLEQALPTVFGSQTGSVIRLVFLLLMVAVNGAKFGFMVRGMASLGATRFVALDLVAGTLTEAAADTVLFQHPPTLRWVGGAAMMTLGVWLIAQAKAPPPVAPPAVREKPEKTGRSASAARSSHHPHSD